MGAVILAWIAGAIVVAAVAPRPFASGRKHGRGVALILGSGQTVCSLSSIARHTRRQALREFAEYIPADSSGDANPGIGEDQVRSPIPLGIILIGQCSCGHIANQITIVGRVTPIIVACEKSGTDRMQKAGLDGA